MFAGFDNRTIPFVNNGGVIEYRGDQGQQFLQIGATRQIASGDNGFDVFMNLRGTNDGTVAPQHHGQIGAFSGAERLLALAKPY